MIRDELIINGEVVDTGDVSITLEYTNNMLTPVDKITSSKSYTIKLPRTAKNERLLDMPSSVAHVSSCVGKFFPASYRRNGITIIEHAQAYIVGVETGIEVCIIWSNLAPFASWVSANKKLADLDLPATTYSSTGSDWSNRYDNVTLPYVNCGIIQESTGTPVIRTVVGLNFWYVFEKIMNGIGATWRVDNVYRDRAKELIIPCLSFDAGWATESGVYDMSSGMSTLVNVPYVAWKSGRALRRWTDNIFLTENLSALKIDTEGFEFWVHEVKSGSLIMSPLYLDLKCVAGDDNGKILASYPMTVSANKERATMTIHDEVDLSKCNQLQFNIRGYDNTQAKTWLDGYGDIVFRQKYVGVYDGSEYIIQNNAPDVKQIDVVKAFCAMYGLSIVDLGNNTIKFIPYEDLITYKNSSYDWTDLVVNYDKIPNKTQFKVAAFGIKNHYKYAADEKNGTFTADGVLYSNSETLEKEADIMTMAFAASDGDVIPYQERNDNGTLKYVKVKPRVMGMKQYTTYGQARIQLTFKDSLWWDNILQSHYGVIRDILEYPVTITVYARLNETILQNIHMDRLVYLGQTGHYYVIEKITTDNKTDISELTLIQLN